MSQVDRNELQSRTYDYVNELECDKNAEISMKAIEAAKESKGFAAVKVSACCCLGAFQLFPNIDRCVIFRSFVAKSCHQVLCSFVIDSLIHR